MVEIIKGKTMLFCYVILHYRTDEDTIECVDSIIATDNDSQIVIIDNASNNGSIEKIEKKYTGENRVHILRNKSNLGFAEGNNRGYKYARNILKADFIAVSNNDVLIKTDDFPTHVASFYERIPFHVLGPDIVSMVDGGHQNPMEESLTTKREVNKEIWRYRLLLCLNRLGIYDLLKHNSIARTGSSRREVNYIIQHNVMLHGSFVIFSPDFIKNEDISFRQGTFLYTEEAILKKYCENKGYDMVFNPFLQVIHKEDSATNSLGYTTKEKREFVFSNMINSLSVYKRYF